MSLKSIDGGWTATVTPLLKIFIVLIDETADKLLIIDESSNVFQIAKNCPSVYVCFNGDSIWIIPDSSCVCNQKMQLFGRIPS